MSSIYPRKKKMSPSKYEDPEWIAEKMFGEEFDSAIVYYVVDPADQFVLYSGTFENCNKVLEENYAGLAIVDYSQLTQEMIKSIPEPF